MCSVKNYNKKLLSCVLLYGVFVAKGFPPWLSWLAKGSADGLLGGDTGVFICKPAKLKVDVEVCLEGLGMVVVLMMVVLVF